MSGPKSAQKESKRRFELVRAPLAGQSAIPIALLSALILAGALLGALLLNTRMVNESYEIARLQGQVARVVQDVQVKHEQLRGAQAALPGKALELGMVPAEQQVALDVSGEARRIAMDLGIINPDSPTGVDDEASADVSSEVDVPEGVEADDENDFDIAQSAEPTVSADDEDEASVGVSP